MQIYQHICLSQRSRPHTDAAAGRWVQNGSIAECIQLQGRQRQRPHHVRLQLPRDLRGLERLQHHARLSVPCTEAAERVRHALRQPITKLHSKKWLLHFVLSGYPWMSSHTCCLLKLAAYIDGIRHTWIPYESTSDWIIDQSLEATAAQECQPMLCHTMTSGQGRFTTWWTLLGA